MSITALTGLFKGKTDIKKMSAAIDATATAMLAKNPATVVLTASDEADGTALINIRIADAAGTTIAQRAVVRFWVAAASFGAPNAGAGQTAFAVTGGTELDEETNLADYRILTAATGLAEVTLTGADATYHIMAECNGLAYTTSVTITGN